MQQFVSFLIFSWREHLTSSLDSTKLKNTMILDLNLLDENLIILWALIKTLLLKIEQKQDSSCTANSYITQVWPRFSTKHSSICVDLSLFPLISKNVKVLPSYSQTVFSLEFCLFWLQLRIEKMWQRKWFKLSTFYKTRLEHLQLTPFLMNAGQTT